MSKSNYDKIRAIYKAVRKIIYEGELGLVGGCVRDSELGLEPKDYDFCTNLTPDRVEELAKEAGRHVYTIGKRFGTTGFRVEIEKRWIYVEVTTYRTEKYTNGSRKPEVEFGTDLREDLKRRDFTINSLWFGSKDPEQEPELLDLFAGRLDLDDHLIKSVGDPKKMLSDDPLRILRAIRFACKYNFNIEPNLLGCCKKSNKKLWNVAIERQTTELDKILTSGNAERGLELLQHIEVLDMLLPELQDTRIAYDGDDPDWAWKRLLYYVGGYKKKDDFGSEYYVYDKPKHDFLCKGICARFKFSNNRTKVIIGD